MKTEKIILFLLVPDNSPYYSLYTISFLHLLRGRMPSSNAETLQNNNRDVDSTGDVPRQYWSPLGYALLHNLKMTGTCQVVMS